MKLIVSASTCLAAALLAGCASSETKLSSSLGPRPGVRPSGGPMGTLQVFTAHQKIDSDLGFEEFFTGEEALRQFDEPAHTDYALYENTGKFLRKIRNARDSQDPDPACLALSPGGYQVRGESEGPSGLRTMVMVPVVVEAGRTTRVHLDGRWAQTDSLTQTTLVHLPTGQAIGWLSKRSQEVDR